MDKAMIALLAPMHHEITSWKPVLEEKGYCVSHYVDPDSMKAAIAEDPPSLIIFNADLNKQEQDVLTPWLRDLRHMRVLAVTASPETVAELATRHRWKVDDYAMLPIQPNDLQAMVAYLLGERADRPYLRNLGEVLDSGPRTYAMRRTTRKLPAAGDLEKISFERLLSMILRCNLSGRLELGAAEQIRDLYFTEGRLLEMRTTYLPGLGLGDLLVERGVLNPDQLPEHLQQARRQDMRLGELLRQQQLVDQPTLRETLGDQASAKLSAAFTWEKGPYKYTKGDYRKRISEPLEISLTQLAFKAACQATRQDDFQARLDSWASKRLVRHPSPAIRLNQLELTQPQKRLVFQIDGQRTLDEICAGTDLPADETRSLLGAMLLLRLLIPM